MLDIYFNQRFRNFLRFLWKFVKTVCSSLELAFLYYNGRVNEQIKYENKVGTKVGVI